MEIKKEFIYLTNAFSLFLVKHIDRIKIAAILTSKAIKAGFEFIYSHPSEKTTRDKNFRQYCDELFKALRKYIK